MGRVARTLAWTLALSVLAPSGVAAQDDRPETVLRGQVMDVDGMPLPLALVGLSRSNEAVMTDSLGRFALPVGPAVGYRLAVEQLGYHDTEVWVEAEDADLPLMIVLRRDPIALEGLQVTVDRFERRRNFYSGIVRVVDQKDLAFTAATSAYDIVRRNAPMMRPCSGSIWRDCVMRRGQLTEMLICVDERRAYGGRDELELYQPEELYMVEVYDFGRAVRLYTRWYVDKVMKNPRPVVPVEFGC